MIINTYNYIIHRSTNHTPKEVFYLPFWELFDEVMKNLLKSFRYLENLYFNFKVNEKMLIYYKA